MSSRFSSEKIYVSRKFYEDVFGWKVEAWLPNYLVATTVKGDKDGKPTEVGGINGALMEYDDHNQTTVVTMEVDSIDNYLKKIEAAGGATVLSKQKVGEMGFMARAIDSEENVIGLWEDIKK